jgi:hypothetical protein
MLVESVCGAEVASQWVVLWEQVNRNALMISSLLVGSSPVPGLTPKELVLPAIRYSKDIFLYFSMDQHLSITQMVL